MKLSLVIPSIRNGTWYSIVSDMKFACQSYDFEVIFVGPFPLPQELVDYPNVKYVKDLGCPSRCLQIGALLAEGEYIAWASDDCRILPNKFDEAIEHFDKNLTENDGMTLMYSEGQDFTGNQHEDPTYWRAHTHPDLRWPGVDSEWKIAPIGMYKTKTFYKYGGLDCAFETVNFNTHDFAFSVQYHGGKVVTSPSRVMMYNWNPDSLRPSYRPIFLGFMQDQIRMREVFINPDYIKNKTLTMDNWKLQPAVWPKRTQ